MKGYQLRFLEFEHSLVKPDKVEKYGGSVSGDLQASAFKTYRIGQDEYSISEMTCKPDNSEENCNLCVTGLDPKISEKSLERIFSETYGKVKSCKISKSEDGTLHNYGFVWFENAKSANKAKLDSKRNKEVQTNYGPIQFNLDWYQIPSLRQKDKPSKPGQVKQEQRITNPFNQVLASWQTPFGEDDQKITEKDLRNYFNKVGNVKDVKMLENQNSKAVIFFNDCKDAEHAVELTDVVIKGI